MKVTLPDGQVVEVGNDALLNDDGTPFVLTNPQTTPPPGTQYFTAEDIARARSEEKDKLYGRIEALTTEINGFRDQVGTLSAAEEQRQQQAEAERQRLEAAARAKEEEELDAKALLQKKSEEWAQSLDTVNKSWEQKFAEEQKRREEAEALRAKEAEFNDLRDYAQAQVTAHTEDIAPQLVGWIQGNSREEIDAAVARAIETTNAIVADMQASQQQVVPGQQIPVPAAPQVPVGVRATGGPGNTDPAAFQQTLTAEQIAAMPMDQYAKLRGNLGVTRGNNNQGMFG